MSFLNLRSGSGPFRKKIFCCSRPARSGRNSAELRAFLMFENVFIRSGASSNSAKFKNFMGFYKKFRYHLQKKQPKTGSMPIQINLK